MPSSNPWSNSSSKKRQIKQGAMQELLTGKKRLPGFSGEWEVKRLGTLWQTSNAAHSPPNRQPHLVRRNVSVGWVRIRHRT